MTRLEQGYVQMEVVLGIVGALGDGPYRLANLQAQIPKRIKDRLDEGRGGRRMTRDEHKEVDVTEWAELGPAVAAGGDQADRRGRGTCLQEQRVKKDIDRVGPQSGDFASADAGAMGGQLEIPGLGQEDLGARDELAFQSGLPGQPVLERGAAEQDGGSFVFGRHATKGT